MDEKQTKRIEKIFPDYFDRFEMPAGAREENIKVYRACRSGKCDRDSFLPSFEENGFTLNPLADPTDPGQYSLSTFESHAEIHPFLFVFCVVAKNITQKRYFRFFIIQL